MATTLSKGYKNPTTGDRGSEWFEALNFNILRVNAHKHNGIDGEKIDASNINRSISTILASAWGSDLGGSTYKQTITVPVNVLSIDEVVMKFIINDGVDVGTVIYPTVQRITPTTYDVFVNDNSLNLKVVYG